MKNFNYDEFRLRKLPSEAEIMLKWQGDPSKPLVSIICITFNHQNYIEDALRGFLIQQTDFPFEIIIHDDASTDKTQEIITRYTREYPDLIKLVIQTENQYSQGKSISPHKFSHAEILAICEGDDFWIDNQKLSIQTKLMLADQGTAFVVHPCINYRSHAKKNKVSRYWGDKVRRFNAQDVLNVAMGFAPTSSYMIRRRVYDIFPSWLDGASADDFFIEMYSLSLGAGLYTPEVMSAYRTPSVGSWTDRRRKAKGNVFISSAQKMNNYLDLMQQEEIFAGLNFDAKKSAIHLDLATGYLLNNNFRGFKKHIVESHRLCPNACLLQRVFWLLRWFPIANRMLFEAKRRFKPVLSFRAMGRNKRPQLKKISGSAP